jgi:beta-phosphoglucomutase
VIVLPHLPRAVLWDMDGTLVDSADSHWEAWRDVMAAAGRPISYGEFLASFGQRNDTILRGWLGEDTPDDLIARIGDEKEARYRALVRERGIALLPGAAEWLERLRAGGWRQAIGSAAPRANIEAIIAALGLEGVFDAIVSAEDVRRGKPDPQVYALAAERLGVPPARAVVVEDAPAGVEAGRRAGARTVGVGPKHAALGADIHARWLSDLPPDTFERLVLRDAC